MAHYACVFQQLNILEKKIVVRNIATKVTFPNFFDFFVGI